MDLSKAKVATNATAEWRRILSARSGKDQQSSGWDTLLRASLHASGTFNDNEAVSTMPLPSLLYLLDTLAISRALDASMHSKPASGQEDMELHELVEHFYIYIQEMYLPLKEDHTVQPWSPPFCLDTAVLPSSSALYNIGIELNNSTEEHIPHFLSVLKQTSSEALAYLQIWEDASGIGLLELLQRTKQGSAMANATNPKSLADVEVQNLSGRGVDSRKVRDDVVLLEASRDCQHIPLQPKSVSEILITEVMQDNDIPAPDVPLQSTISQALADKRTNLSPTSPNTLPSPYTKRSKSISHSSTFGFGVSRWILASLLRHYCGQDFGQSTSSDHGNQVRYAKLDDDDQAVRTYFSGHKRASKSESILSHDSIDPHLHAEIQAAKRGDKLKWLFGESLTTKQAKSGMLATRLTLLDPPSPMSPIYDPSDKQYHRMTRSATSPGYFESVKKVVQDVQLYPESDTTESSSPHRRAYSAGNEVKASSPSSSTSHSSQLFRFQSPTNLRFDTSDGGHADAGRGLESMDDFVSDDSHARNAGINHPASVFRVKSLDTVDSRTRLLDHSLSRNHLTGSDLGPHSHSLTAPIRGPVKNVDYAHRRHSFDSVFTDAASLSGCMPLTVNNLSAEEKQNLVRKNKKLTAVLGSRRGATKALHIQTSGSGLQSSHEDLEDVLTPTPRAQNVQAHIPKDAPLQAKLVSLVDDEEDGVPFISPLMASVEAGLVQTAGLSQDDPGLDKAMDSPASDTEAQAEQRRRHSTDPAVLGAREARRRKLMKVQSFLGERVPASALLEQAALPRSPLRALPISPVPSHKKRAKKILARASSKLLARGRPLSMIASGVGQRVGGSRKVKAGSTPVSPSEHGDSATKQDQNDSLAIIEHHRRQRRWGATKKVYYDGSSDDEGGHSPIFRVASKSMGIMPASNAEPAIAAIRRARKLEKVFGAQPPQHAVEQKYKKPVARDDTSTFSRSLSLSRSNWTRPGLNLGPSLALSPSRTTFQTLKTRSSISSLSQYRQSIASLRYIAESGDMQLLNDFAKVVLAEESEEDTENLRASQFNKDGRGESAALPQSPHIGLDPHDSGNDGDVTNEGPGETDEDDEADIEEVAEVKSASLLRRHAARRSRSVDSKDRLRWLAEPETGESFEEVVGGSSIAKLSLELSSGSSSTSHLHGSTNFPRARSESNSSVFQHSGSSAAKPQIFQNAAYYQMQQHLRKRFDSALSGKTVYSRSDSAYELHGSEELHSDPELFAFSPFGDESDDNFSRRDFPSVSARRAYGTDTQDLGSLSSFSRPSSRSSLESVRIQFKRAHKLAKVFGTTRGEIFERVLKGIEDDIAELEEAEEEIDEEEKKEILENLAALRAAVGKD